MWIKGPLGRGMSSLVLAARRACRGLYNDCISSLGRVLELLPLTPELPWLHLASDLPDMAMLDFTETLRAPAQLVPWSYSVLAKQKQLSPPEKPFDTIYSYSQQCSESGPVAHSGRGCLESSASLPMSSSMLLF